MTNIIVEFDLIPTKYHNTLMRRRLQFHKNYARV